MAASIKTIALFDNLISKHDLQKTQAYFEENVRWKFGWPQGKADPFSHWNCDFLKVKKNNLEEVTSKLTTNESLAALTNIWHSLEQGPLHGHQIIRCYANAHTFGIEGYPHVDVDEKTNPDCFTTIVYINPIWSRDWAGELVIFDDLGEVCFCAAPKPGRVITFPAGMVHAARAVSRSCSAIRVSVVFKTIWKP